VTRSLDRIARFHSPYGALACQQLGSTVLRAGATRQRIIKIYSILFILSIITSTRLLLREPRAANYSIGRRLECGDYEYLSHRFTHVEYGKSQLEIMLSCVVRCQKRRDFREVRTGRFASSLLLFASN
jgi:hypothetical protein